jgi:hypothetical protein
MLANIAFTNRYRTKPTLQHQDLERSQMGSIELSSRIRETIDKFYS